MAGTPEFDDGYGGRHQSTPPRPRIVNVEDLPRPPQSFVRESVRTWDSLCGASAKCPTCLRPLEQPPYERDSYLACDRCPSYVRTNRRTIRYDDGEIIRYGAGESYRPFNNRDRDRSPRRPRSPLRDRDRERDRDRDRDRDHRPRTPPIGSDSYVPNRSPRRRSRSPDRYRGPDRARDVGGESWRRRDNSRGRVRSPPVRRISPRRSPRRSPGRYSPPLRRDDRFDRARSPRRDFEIRDR